MRGKFVELGIYESDKSEEPIRVVRWYFIKEPVIAEELYSEVLAELRKRGNAYKEKK